jgi:UDP-glucose:tetrahydrobiopterin glucosyltransferase
VSERRILLASTPVGPLGSGIGGGVELTLHNLVYGLGLRGHHVEVVAPAGSLHVGERVHQVDGTLQVSSQIQSRDAPIEMPSGSVLAAMWNKVFDIQDQFDVVINLAYDWLPLYLTPHLRVPVLHLVSMGSLNDVIDAALADLDERLPGRLAVHSQAQADTFPAPTMFRIVGNGIVTERYDVRSTADAEAALGFVGRISPEKGLEDVASLSERTGRPVRVWGMMQDEVYWNRIVAEHPGAGLDYRGFLPTDELQSEIGRCAALVMTPKWVEAFGNVAIEAMATGVPVVTYDRGGPAEIVVDGRTGFVVPPDDVEALAAAVDRIDEIDRLECRRRVDDEFSSLAMADRIITWVDDVLDAATVAAGA